MANYISQIQTPDGTLYTIYDRNAPRKNQVVYYIEGSAGDTAGVWTGSLTGLDEPYWPGLTVLYVPKVDGSDSGCTLNINDLGAKPCYIGESRMTTQGKAGTPMLFTLSGNRWVYVSNDTKVRVTRHTSGYDAEYPILVSGQTTIGTAGQEGSYSDVEAIIYNSNIPTVNPSTGAITAPGGFVGNASTADKVNHSLYLGPHQYDGSADVVVGIYDGENE